MRVLIDDPGRAFFRSWVLAPIQEDPVEGSLTVRVETVADTAVRWLTRSLKNHILIIDDRYFIVIIQ